MGHEDERAELAYRASLQATVDAVKRQNVREKAMGLEDRATRFRAMVEHIEHSLAALTALYTDAEDAAHAARCELDLARADAKDVPSGQSNTGKEAVLHAN